jgi:hypothetical protein
MEFLMASGYMLAAMVVLSLFALADWSAKNNLPPTLRDELEKVMAGYGRTRNRPVHAGRNRDTFAVHHRGAECIEKSV